MRMLPCLLLAAAALAGTADAGSDSGPAATPATLPNLTWWTPPGWAAPLVPREFNDSNHSSVPAPGVLPGDGAGTWWNCLAVNGSPVTVPGFRFRAFVDGDWNGTVDSVNPLPPGVTVVGQNLGPLVVRGGRHTFGYLIDAENQIAESNELDNFWARQWIWSPAVIAAGSPVTRAAPPAPTGGWEFVVDGSPLYPNQDGLRLGGASWWTAVVLRPLGGDADHDLTLHQPSPGAGAGFAAALSASSLPAGYLEFIVINHNTMGWGAAFDVGVSNSNGTGSGYEIVQVNNRELGFGIPSTVGYAADQMLHLFEFPVTAENVGPVSLTVDVDPAAGPLEIAWLPRSFQTGGIAGAAAWAATDPTGRARLDVNIAEAGYYALVVYRHPDWSDGNPPLEVTVKVARTPPDFLPPLLPGWHAPIVPRPAFDGRPDWVPAPTTLPGNVSSTVLNLAVRNNSPVLVEAALYGAVHLDGVWWRVRPWWGFAAASTETEHFLGPLSVRGGRHTLSWKLDPDNLIEEISETNNDWTEQWVWTPLALSPADAPIVRDLPPAMWGGWTELSTGEPFYPNCDGLRLPNTGSYWRAVAVMPGAGRDVALQLHEASSGAKHGFEISLALSWWGGDASEYVLVNLNRAPNLDYDVGVLGSGEAGQYTAHMAQTSGYLAFPDGSYGPYGLPPDRILDLHEVYLPGGPTGIHLMNAAGDVDWGLSLHPAQGAFQGKADALGAAWLAGAGANELLVVDVPEPGFYCIAVWKTDANQLAKDGAYSLLIRPMWASDAEDDVPALATRLVDIAPNPFNPQTRITYELAQPGRVQLEVYDLQGRRVRTLVDLEQGAGRHDEVWNGLDDAGGRAASGLYMARLTAAGVTRMMKMTLVK